MRAMTVEELAAARTEAVMLSHKLVKLTNMVGYYEAECELNKACDGMDGVIFDIAKAVNALEKRIASARTDAEAGKADAKRKDV